MGAERYGLAIHYHAVVTDPLGNRPEFCRWFHEFVAKCINSDLGRWENLWAPETPSIAVVGPSIR